MSVALPAAAGASSMVASTPKRSLLSAALSPQQGPAVPKHLEAVEGATPDTSSAKKKALRKGGLSMFLAGEEAVSVCCCPARAGLFHAFPSDSLVAGFHCCAVGKASAGCGILDGS